MATQDVQQEPIVAATASELPKKRKSDSSVLLPGAAYALILRDSPEESPSFALLDLEACEQQNLGFLKKLRRQEEDAFRLCDEWDQNPPSFWTPIRTGTLKKPVTITHVFHVPVDTLETMNAFRTPITKVQTSDAQAPAPSDVKENE